MSNWGIPGGSWRQTSIVTSDPSQMPINDVLNKLDGVKGGGGKWIGKCPAHADENPSLSIGVGNDGRVLLHCFGGCETRDVLEAVGLRFKDLFHGIQ